MAARVHDGERCVRVAAEAVHHEADVARMHVAEDFEGLALAVARVDDEGLADGLRGLDVAAKTCALPVKRLLAPVEVEPRLAHGGEPRARTDLGDPLDGGLGLVGKFGMKRPGAEEPARMLREERLELRELVVLAGDDHGGRHARRLHARDDLVAVLVEGVAVEMAV